ncbi:polyamine aminopropyltransferase [Cucumibacter marinus]|uniref:polyamine aminopropyltransferase n=1 Tax=Cucumibacter marinus TaxID=1121252 RepID=UPI00040E9170|nr:polyamine aminopropyltransferase [Cucumibacter marinus]
MSGNGDDKRWFEERLYDSTRYAFRADKVIYEEDTEFQHLALFENEKFGRVLMLDGVTQVTTADEFIYHEMMTHVPILAHGAAERVLVIGGGDCGIANQVLKHTSVKHLTQVEIDPSVIEFAKTHFSVFNASVFEDDRFHSVIADGMKFVAETDERFDVIIVDSTDPIGPGEVLFSQAFYDACAGILTGKGIMVTQNGVPFMQADELVTSISRFKKSFTDASAYLAAIPTYIGGHMAMGWASHDGEARFRGAGVLTERFAKAGFDTRYYTPRVHAGAFALPRFIEELIEKGLQQG